MVMKGSNFCDLFVSLDSETLPKRGSILVGKNLLLQALNLLYELTPVKKGGKLNMVELLFLKVYPLKF